MKKMTLILAGAICLWGCQHKDKGAFELNAELQHAPLHAPVYLDQLQIEGTKTIDTAKIEDASGKFAFKGMMPEEGLYRIRFEDGKMLLLALNEGNINVKGDYAKLEDAKITGSDASVQLNQFLHGINEQSLHLNTLAMEYDSLKNGGTPDSILLPREQELQTLESGISSYVIQFADTTHSPACAVFALSILQSQEDIVNAKPIFDSLSHRFPNNGLVQSMVKAYTQMMNGPATAVNTGQLAPDISLPDPDGKILTLSNFKGKYVLVDFWASWCGPCRQENPNVVKAYNEFKGKNFTIFSVSLDSKKDNWTKAISDDKLAWNHVSDLKGWDSAPAAAYGVQAIPANFLLDPEGKVIAQNLRGEDLENKLKEVLK